MVYHSFSHFEQLLTKKNPKAMYGSIISPPTHLDVPAKWSKLLPFLYDSMEETNAKHNSPPVAL